MIASKHQTNWCLWDLSIRQEFKKKKKKKKKKIKIKKKKLFN